MRAPCVAHTYAAVGFGRQVEVKAEVLENKKSTHSSEKCCAGAYGLSPLKQCQCWEFSVKKIARKQGADLVLSLLSSKNLLVLAGIELVLFIAACIVCALDFW